MSRRSSGLLRPEPAGQLSGSDDATSWAGHDAGVLGSAGVAVGMLFVRAGRGGVSHSPQETVDLDDIGVAVSALAEALGDLADRAP